MKNPKKQKQKCRFWKRRYNMPLLTLVFIAYIIGFVVLMYKTDKNVTYMEIPIKYRSNIFGMESGIVIGEYRGGHDISFQSEDYPNITFETKYFNSIRKTKSFFRKLEKSKPHHVSCFIEKKYLNKIPEYAEKNRKREKSFNIRWINTNIPFIYSSTEEKGEIYWLNLCSYVKSRYFLVWNILFGVMFLLFCFIIVEQNDIKLSASIILSTSIILMSIAVFLL